MIQDGIGFPRYRVRGVAPNSWDPILSIRDEPERLAARNMSLRPTPPVRRQKSIPCPAIKTLAAAARQLHELPLGLLQTLDIPSPALLAQIDPKAELGC